ncbi:MAG: hypothetical protein KDC53_08495 [Saprospiraceae bacterium]|nr:hypothetical protein [Saprospiraceae bacterium]
MKKDKPFSSFLTSLILSHLPPGILHRLASSKNNDLRLSINLSISTVSQAFLWVTVWSSIQICKNRTLLSIQNYWLVGAGFLSIY